MAAIGKPDSFLNRNSLFDPWQPEKLTPLQLFFPHCQPLTRARRQHRLQIPRLRLQPAINEPSRVVRERVQERLLHLRVLDLVCEEGALLVGFGDGAGGVVVGAEDDGVLACFEGGVFDADVDVPGLGCGGGRLGGLDVVEEDDGVWGLEVLVDEGGELVELEDVCSEDLKMREKRDEFGESWRVEGGLGLGLIGGWDAPLSNYRRA